MSSDGKEHQALERILSRAATDSEFRQRLLTEPKEAIRAEFGVIIPNTFRIKFIERGQDVDALVVLPDLKPNGDQLSDTQLEWVSGGADHYTDLWAEGPDEDGDAGDSGFAPW